MAACSYSAEDDLYWLKDFSLKWLNENSLKSEEWLQNKWSSFKAELLFLPVSAERPGYLIILTVKKILTVVSAETFDM